MYSERYVDGFHYRVLMHFSYTNVDSHEWATNVRASKMDLTMKLKKALFLSNRFEKLFVFGHINVRSVHSSSQKVISRFFLSYLSKR